MIRVEAGSPDRPCGVATVFKELGLPRSSHYARAAREAAPMALQKRGPKPLIPDEALIQAIRQALSSSPFLGEGYRKVHARLRYAGIRVGKPRVMRLMREHGLQAPAKGRRSLGPRAHDGTITTDRPDQMWGTDMTNCFTLNEGQAAVFGVVDHCTGELLGIHASKIGTRFEALEPVRQAVRSSFGGFQAALVSGLKLRHDNGTQYTSDAFHQEIRWLGIESSPSFIRAPEGNGVIERFWRTLKEQLLWIRSFQTVEELRLALHAFKEHYNHHWLIQRHGHRTPTQVRIDLTGQATAA